MIYQHLRRILPGLKSPVVLELGAHIGTDTVKLLALCSKPLYLAVEPDYRNVALLESLKEKHRLDFTVIDKAIAGWTGQATLYLSDGLTEQGRQYTDGSAILKPAARALQTGYTWNQTTPVRAITLDDLSREYRLSKIDFIWADIQGAELEMIAGGQAALTRTGYLYTEYCKDLYRGAPGKAEILAALPGKWVVIMDDGMNMLVKNGRTGE